MIAVDVTIDGAKEAAAELRYLERVASDKAIAAGGRKALQVYTQAAQVGLAGSWASARMKRSTRRLIGWSLKTRQQTIVGKFGFGVGRAGKSRPAKTRKRGMAFRGGVGMAKETIHWAVLGTVARKTRRGRYLGSMPAVLQNIIPAAASSAATLAMQAATAAIDRFIQRAIKRSK